MQIILIKILTNQIQQHIKRIITWPTRLYSWNASIIQHTKKKINVIHHINKKDKTTWLSQLLQKKSISQNSTCFHDKNTQNKKRNTDLPEFIVGLHPDKPIISWKYLKSKMHLIHLTYQTSCLYLASLKHAQNNYISLQLGRII